MSNIFLVTGERRTGKTTIIKKIVETIGPERCGGFYTEEVRENGHRVGFRVVTLDGQTQTIADIRSGSPIRVEIYGVDLASFETVAVNAIIHAEQNKDVVVVDEIGPMQLFSEEFRNALSSALDSSHVFLGTVVLRSHPWADELKARQGIHLVELTTDTRDEVTKLLIEALLGQSHPQH